MLISCRGRFLRISGQAHVPRELMTQLPNHFLHKWQTAKRGGGIAALLRFGYYFFVVKKKISFFEPRPTQHPTKWAPKLTGMLPERDSDHDLTYQGHLGPSCPGFWRVLGSMLRLLGSNLAPTWRPRALQNRPRAPKSRPRQAKSCPRADQDTQEQPRTSR